MKENEAELTRLREEAWVGDAVLALFVREWILRETGALDGEMFVRFTSNDFLRGLGNPTRVEAGIGAVYRERGLGEAFKYMECKLLPLFKEREKVRAKQLQSGRKLRG